MNIRDMRNLLIWSLLCSSLMLLVACGQSGALMLPSDPDYDKRARYLLHDHHPLDNDKQGANPPISQQSSQPSSTVSEAAADEPSSKN